MADTNAAVEETAQIPGQASVVAPPKFVFGQSMEERVKDDSSDENLNLGSRDVKNESEAAEGRHNTSKKRSVEDDKEDTTESDGPLSPVKKVARVFKWSTEEEDDEPRQFKFKPSILTEVAKNLKGAAKSSKEENSNTASSHPKTFGLSTSESTSTETRSGASAPEPAIGHTKNYFQMFLNKNDQSLEHKKAGSFVFGCNMGDRVTFATHADDDSEIITNPDKHEEPSLTEQPVIGQPVLEDKEPKTLEQVAKSFANDGGPKSPSPSPDKHHLSLAEAAKFYEDTVNPTSKLEQVEVVTGEEEERNVIQINCRLFLFDVDNHSWREKGRGFLRLNDMCKSSSDSTFQSRLVMRTQGHLRVTLNTKLWPEMTLDRANDKSLRLTGLDAENEVKIYLIMAGPKDIQQLFTAIDRRIQALKRDKEEQQPIDCIPDSTTNTQDTTDTLEKDDCKPATSVQVNQDESSNDSCPIRSKDSFSDDE